jgi:hypothetical protein
MDTFMNYVGQKLKWVSSSDKKSVAVLLANETMIASLEIKGKLISDGIAQCGSETWHFKRSGFLKNAITIYQGDQKQEYARFKKNGMNFGGKLECKTGQKLLVSVNRILSEYIVTNEQKDNLIGYHVFVNGPDPHTDVEIYPPAAAIPDLSCWVTVIEFMSLMQHLDAAFNAAASGW